MKYKRNGKLIIPAAIWDIGIEISIAKKPIAGSKIKIRGINTNPDLSKAKKLAISACLVLW